MWNRIEIRGAVKIACVLLMGLSVMPPLAAEDWQNGVWKYRVELFGDAAWNSFGNGNSNWGHGSGFGGGAAVRPFSGWISRLAFEVRGARMAEEKENAIMSTRMDASLVAFDAVFHFAQHARVQPYVLGGVGIVKANYTRTCSACVYVKNPVTGQYAATPYDWRAHDTKLGATFGFGMKVAVVRRLSVRTELFFADTTPGSGWNWTWMRLQIGAGVHF